MASSSTARVIKAAPAHYQERAHYKECIIYQIYPASFADSNGDGVGDIQGIISKLDYLKELGIDAIWLSPVFKSPLVDMGYDISDYQDIDPRFGTLADMDELISEMHKRDLKLVMDLVVNHTSDQHHWFQESRKSKDNPYRDWYWWRPPRWSEFGERLPPNNWREEFANGSAWEWDETTQEYYLHLYCKEQPDLNWETPAVRKAVYEDIMKWWLDRGADGFRMDVINLISKDSRLPDAKIQDPDEKYQWSYEYTANGPRIHEFLREMNREVLSKYPHIITVGETPFCHHDFDLLVPYVLPENGELQTVFQFEQQEVDGYPPIIAADYKLSEFKEVTSRWQVGMQERGGWNSIYLENHDQARSVSRFGDDSTPELRSLSAMALATMQCTQSGTLYVYQGEEIGMANLPASVPIEEYKDIATQTYYAEELMIQRQKANSAEPDMSKVLDNIQRKARDHGRTPMQWNATAHAGFSNAKETWMKVNDDYEEWHAENQVGREDSVHTYWRDMLAFRKKHLASTYGIYNVIDAANEQVFAYTKDYQTERLTVVINFTKNEVSFSLPETVDASCSFGNYEKAATIDQGGKINLRPWEAVVYVSELKV